MLEMIRYMRKTYGVFFPWIINFTSLIYFIFCDKSEIHFFSAFLMLPSLILCGLFVHEFGHYMACILFKYPITEIKIESVYIDARGLKLLKKFDLICYVTFVRKEKNIVVFLAGPIASLAWVVLWLVIVHYTRNVVYLYALIVACVVCLLIFVPTKNNDFRLAGKECIQR